MVFLDSIERLQLDPDKVMSIHSLNPDRLTTVAEMKSSLGRKYYSNCIMLTIAVLRAPSVPLLIPQILFPLHSRR